MTDGGPRRRAMSALAVLGEEGFEDGLCAACARLLDVSGVAVTVVANGMQPGLLCASDEVAAGLQNLQETLGQGPSIDAQAAGVPVVEPILANPGSARWEGFAGAAVALGAAAVFAFPMRVGAARVGVLTAYDRRAGHLRDGQYADALAAADVVTHMILAVQADAPPGVLATALESVAVERADVHQATGMLAARLGISVTEALVRIRAHSYAHDRDMLDVARDIIRRRIDLD